MRPPLHLLPTILLLTAVHSSPNNFCGSDWTDASSDCQNRQPCPDGTDDECDSGICWADTLCDTTKGDGILFDKENPQHQRFCGNSWNDAADNCSPERHCASGDSSECQNGEACYSFLSGCNYVDMIVGSGGGDGGGSDDEEDSGGPPRLDGNSPMRSNWCGSDWNDAIAHCTDSSHWCPSGSDSDCPDGKVCFAGTDCKFVDDLHPTESPTPGPSITPTESPLVYETIENTRFCGSGWEDAQKNCQISRHCPQGKNTECPAGMTCFSWMSGCNIIDMNDYLDTYGVEIYGADRIEMDPSGNDSGSTPIIDSTNGTSSQESSDSSSTTYEWPEAGDESDNQSTTGVPPSLSLGVWTSQPAPIERTPPPRWTAAPLEFTSTAPVAVPADGFYPEHHVFCGESWFDAQNRCSEETFCSDGAATHVCEKDTEFCWVGITACDAGEWLLGQETPSPILSTSAPFFEGTLSPVASATIDAETSAPIQSAAIDEETIAPIESGGSFPTFAPSITTETTTNAPAEPTITNSFTTTSDEPSRFHIQQSYCAENYIHLIQDCLVLEICNNSPCPDGLSCFKNVLCDKPATDDPGSIAIDDIITPAPIIAERVTPLPSPSPVASTDSPVLLLLLTQDTATPTSLSLAPSLRPITLSPETKDPTQQPTMFSLTEAEVAHRMSNPNNYCARDIQEIRTTCSYALRTCNDDDPMCDLGTNCFGGIICPGPTNSPTTTPPVSTPVITTTLEPIALSVDDAANINPAAQSYCAESGELVQSTCATGFTCNEGPQTCPFGTSCFSNIVCEALINQNDSTDKTTIAPIENSDESKEFVGNYCAESEEMVQSTCKDAIICNDGFGTCPFGTFCFSNVVCKELQGQNDQSIDNSESSSNRDPTEENECNDLCMKPLDSGDCDYNILSMGLQILPCTGMSTENEKETGIDQICAGTGRCGTSLDLNNCDTNEDLYLRVNVSFCVEAGLGSSGVLLPDTSQSISTPASVDSETAETQTDATGFPAATTVASDVNHTVIETEKPPDDPIVYPWDQPSKNVTSNKGNQAEIDSWWILQEAGASGRRIRIITSFGLASFLLILILL